jgi:hypothetical protein
MLSVSVACSGQHDHAGEVESLRVVMRPTPTLKATNFRTAGSFPQVSGNDVAVTSVNRELLRAVLTEEHVWRQTAMSAYGSNPLLRTATQSGVFQISVDRHLSSASTRVVSFLMPELAMLPNGTGGEAWLSITIDVASARVIRLQDVLEGVTGLRRLASSVFHLMKATNRCFASEAPLYHGVRGAFSAHWGNYRDFSLTPSGIAIGFPTASIAPPPCGRSSATVPYNVIGPYLSPRGKALIAGVRAPS